MSTLRVVEHLNAVEDIRSCIVTTECINSTTDALALEQLQEAFGKRLLAAIAAPAHAADQVLVTQDT